MIVIEKDFKIEQTKDYFILSFLKTKKELKEDSGESYKLGGYYRHIENAVKAALRGDVYVSASLVDRGVKLRMSLAEELFKGIPNLNCEANCLTEREFEILKLVAQGKSNSEIAKELFVSEKTVKNHLYSAFRKIGVRDRTQAAISVIKSLLSYENGSLDTA